VKKEIAVSLLKNIPKVDKVLELPGVKEALAGHPRPLVLRAVRLALDKLREELHTAKTPFPLHEELLVSRFQTELDALTASRLKRVVNGTGVVIHTNLGRSPLADSLRQGLNDIAFGYSNLEFDLEKGERGSRYSHLEGLLCELTGAEAALVVNNNAAAVLLALVSLAQGREVIVSRGELVEIGGSFRIPDVMRQSGAMLVEVGATNRTHPCDYRGGVTSASALLLKVQASNFAVVGFTAEVSAPELTEIGREFSLPVMADVGSGNLIDLPNLAGQVEPTVQSFVRAGVDVVTFSGDKLLGGPQAGIIVGKKAFIDPMKRHPLLRALRVDKMTVAALEGTLRLFRDERQALAEIPVLRMLTVSAAELSAKGKRLLRRFSRLLPAGVSLSVVNGVSQVGGGALPLAEIPTALIAVHADGFSPDDLEKMFRICPVPVIGRIYRGNYLLDLRTILDSDIPDLLSAFQAIAE
jgi:L-seryl-tRNA(Ser) seleniumtransferase